MRKINCIILCISVMLFLASCTSKSEPNNQIGSEDQTRSISEHNIEQEQLLYTNEFEKSSAINYNTQIDISTTGEVFISLDLDAGMISEMRIESNKEVVFFTEDAAKTTYSFDADIR